MVRSIISCCVLSASTAAAQTPPRDARPAANIGTAVIRGRITDAETGKPLRRARVTLTAPELAGEPRNASTDAEGRYEFADLPGGRFTIRVRRSGYLPLAYGQRRPREAPKPLQLEDKQIVERVDLALPRMAVITGRVFDETGDPMEGINVHAVRLMFRDGRRQLVPVGGGQNRTDDDGEFRLTGLAPGTYYIAAETRETWTVPHGDTKDVMGYAPTYFPGTTQPSEARRITVQVAQRIDNIDFALIPGRAAQISGTAFDSHGNPLTSVDVGEEVRGEGFASFGSVARATVNADGTFVITNVPPGDYVLGAARGRETSDPQIALTDITVGGVDIDNVSLIGSAGATVSGRVVTDDGVVPDLPSLRVTIAERITGQPSPLIVGTFGNQSTAVGSDGSFTVKGVFGRAWLSVNVPDGWAIKSVTHDTQDLTGQPFELRSGDTLTDVQVVVTNRVTSVSGQLVDEKGNPIVDATVIVFATDAAAWTQGTRAVRATRPDQQGQWRIRGLAPGEFLAVAIDYVEEGQWNDPEYLEALRQSAEKVALAEAESKTVSLRVTKPE